MEKNTINKIIIDFHTHCFPDEIAQRTIDKLKKDSPQKPALNGTISDLLSSMDNAKIDISVVCMIATRAGQEDSILRFCKKIRSDRIIPFPSVHYSNNKWKEIIKEIKEEGFKGIKLHPQYQNFDVDAEFMFPIYEEIIKHNLILLLHSGFDSAFPGNLQASPDKTAKVINKFSEIKLVLAHLGAYRAWNEVLQYLVGKNVYFDCSYSLVEYNDYIYDILEKHNKNYIVFGSDSPWIDQLETVRKVENLKIDNDYKEKIFYKNAKQLLGL